MDPLERQGEGETIVGAGRMREMLKIKRDSERNTYRRVESERDKNVKDSESDNGEKEREKVRRE